MDRTQDRQGKHSNGPIHPIIEPLALLEFASMNRIEHIYSDFPKVFFKEINLRRDFKRLEMKNDQSGECFFFVMVYIHAGFTFD